MRVPQSKIPIVAFATFAVIVGCSSADDTGNGNPTVCTISLSGAVSIAPTCTGVGASYFGGLDSTLLTVQSNVPELKYIIELPNPFHTGTYSSTDPRGNDEGVSYTSGTIKWLAGNNGNGGAPPGATWTLTISSRTVESPNGGDTVFTVHGTADALLLSNAAGAGAITVHATF